MKHKVNLVWNAFRYSMNSHSLEIFNVIRDDLIADIEKAYRKKELKNMHDLEKIVNRWAMYHYWSKAEHEVVIYDLFDTDDKRGEKHDVYWQLNMNMDRLCEYIAREMKLFN